VLLGQLLHGLGTLVREGEAQKGLQELAVKMVKSAESIK
jgi:hypothetical protein